MKILYSTVSAIVILSLIGAIRGEVDYENPYLKADIASAVYVVIGTQEPPPPGAPARDGLIERGMLIEIEKHPIFRELLTALTKGRLAEDRISTESKLMNVAFLDSKMRPIVGGLYCSRGMRHKGIMRQLKVEKVEDGYSFSSAHDLLVAENPTLRNMTGEKVAATYDVFIDVGTIWEKCEKEISRGHFVVKDLRRQINQTNSGNQ